MDLIGVDTQKCKGDGMCVESCPSGYLTLGSDGWPMAVPGFSCIQCGHCVAVCPHEALSHSLLPREEFEAAQAPAARPGIEAVRGLMASRRSVREFQGQPVPREDLEQLLDIARRAPTAVNSQHIRWIVTLDPARTRLLAELGAQWMRQAGIAPGYLKLWDQGRDVILRGAPHLVLAVAPADYGWAAVDCAIALTYLELAAAAMGLGACWAGLITRAANADPAVIRELGLPQGQQVCGGLMVGLPKYRYRLIPPRKELRADWL